MFLHLRHRAYFVLCSLFFVPQGSKKTNPQSNNNYQKRRPKLTGNHEKVTPGGAPGARGEDLGTILVQWAERTAGQGSYARLFLCHVVPKAQTKPTITAITTPQDPLET